MSLLSAFVGGVAKTRLADMQAADEDKRDLDRFKKQQKILEDMRKSAEDAKVAAKRIVQGGNADEGPQQLMVEEYNPSGRVIGTRAASKGEEDEYVQGKQTRAANLAAAQSEAKMKADRETRAKEKHESDLKVNKAREAASYASAKSSRAYAKNLASPTGNEEDAMKDVTYLLTDPYAREAIDAGDPNIAGRWGQKPGAIESFIKSALSKAGVEVPEVSPSVMASLSKTEDPAVRAQIIQTYVRELRQAQAQGLGKLKGVKPKTEQ